MASTPFVRFVGASASALGAAALLGKLRARQPAQCLPGANLHDASQLEARIDCAKKGTLLGKPVHHNPRDLVFFRMGLSPEEGTARFNALHTNFPGSLPGSVVSEITKRILTDEGLTSTNTLFSRSICPDEINNLPGSMIDTMKRTWGECFPLGGIGGPPFVGVTGWGAFKAHIPENGNIIVIFAPHVGITKEGEIGKVQRMGQSETSTACGALCAAYESCCRNEALSSGTTKDMQQDFLKEMLYPRVGEIQRAPNPMAALAVHSFEIVRDSLMELIADTDLKSGKLVLIGGIQINMPGDVEDHFFPLVFEMHKRGEPPKNFMKSFNV